MELGGKEDKMVGQSVRGKLRKNSRPMLRRISAVEKIPQMLTSAQICDTFILVARLLLTPLIDRSQLGNKLTRNFMLLTQNVTTKTTSYYWNKTETLVNITQC